MTEVLRIGELGLVQGEHNESSPIRVLHLVPHTFSAPDFRLHGSTKDFAGRNQYFKDRGIWFDTFHHRKNVDKLSSKMKNLELPDYTHILVDGSFTELDWSYLRGRWPKAKLILRSHNSELPHRKDTLRALLSAAPTDDMDRQAEDKRDAIKNRRIFLDRDLAAVKYADTILVIETIKQSARYWSWLGFRGELIEMPYFLTDEYLVEIEAKLKVKVRRDWVVCVMSSHPGALTYHSLLEFHRAVNTLGDRWTNWRFRATGRQFWLKNHTDYSPRIKPLGIIEDLLGLLCETRAVAVFSELGRGFKTKILEAILCKAWVLINPELFKRLPEAVKPYCVVVDVDSPFGFDEALDRIGRKEWPGGDPNGELRSQNYAAMDAAFLDGPKAAFAGATLSQDGEARKSKIIYWSSAAQDQSEVTFCTVLTPLHKRVAAHNWELVNLLNPDRRAPWVVVDNHDVHLNDKRVKAFLRQLATTRGKVAPDIRDSYMQSAKEEFYDYGEITDYIPDAKVVQGLTLDQTFDYFVKGPQAELEDQPEARRLLSKFLASYHHASGLDLALQQVRTRYAIVIDPDLYVIRSNWISEVLAHMAEHDLAVFGAPWNPRWYQKFRYFPCTHLMVIDLHKYRWRKDMLAPDLVRGGGKYISIFWQGWPEVRKKGLWPALKHLAKNFVLAVKEDWKQRSTISVSRDTGYNMLEEFRQRSPLKSGTLTPVFSPEEGFQPATVNPPQRLLDAVLPDRLSYVPRRPGYTSRKGFEHHGLAECRSLGWEEFLWKGQPFAFHVRGELHRKPIGRTDDVQVLNRLNAILAHIGRRALTDRTVGGADLHAATETKSWDHLDKIMAEKSGVPAEAD